MDYIEMLAPPPLPPPTCVKHKNLPPFCFNALDLPGGDKRGIQRRRPNHVRGAFQLNGPGSCIFFVKQILTKVVKYYFSTYLPSLNALLPYLYPLVEGPGEVIAGDGAG